MQPMEENELTVLAAQLEELRSRIPDLPPSQQQQQQDGGLLAPAPFSALSHQHQHQQQDPRYATVADPRLPSHDVSHHGLPLDPQLSAASAADSVRFPSNGNATKRTASQAFAHEEVIDGRGTESNAGASGSGNANGNGSASGNAPPSSRSMPDFVRLTAAGGYHSRDPNADADPALRYWVETPSGWITAAAHPFAAAGLPAEETWSAQARKSIEAVPSGYMRFFKLIDRKQRLSNPRGKGKATATTAATAAAISPDQSTEGKDVKMEWRELYRCKACGAEQDSQAGHTENVQKHIRLRKCKRLIDPPFRSGLLQDKDPMVQAVLKAPHAEKGNDRSEAAALVSTAPTQPCSAPVEPATVDAHMLSSIRDFLLQIRQPFSFVGSKEFALFIKEMKMTALDLGQTPEADLIESLQHAESRLDNVLHTGLEVIKERQLATFASLCILPVKSSASTLLAPATHAQVLLWLHHADGLDKVGWFSVGCTTIKLVDPDPQKPSVDATFSAFLQQALTGLGKKGTGSVPVRISNPSLAGLHALSVGVESRVKLDCVPEPAQSISRAAELFLAHLGLDVISKTQHMSLLGSSGAPSSLAFQDLSNLGNTLSTELSRPRKLRAISGKAGTPQSIRKAVSVIYAASEAVLLASSQQPQTPPFEISLVLLDLTRAEPGSFTWRDWAAALVAVHDIQRYPAKKPALLGVLLPMSPAELDELQTIAGLLRQMISVMNMLESPGTSLGNELPVVWSTLASLQAAIQQHAVLAPALQATAEQLKREAMQFAQSKAHLLATILHPSHRLLRLYRLDVTLAKRALDHLILEFGSAQTVPASIDGTQPAMDQSVNYADVFPDLAESVETESIVYSNRELKSLLQRLDPASRTWLASPGSPLSSSMHAYWSEPGRSELLVRAANRYLWMLPNTASKLSEVACSEATQFGSAAAAGGGNGSSGGGIAIEEPVLGLVTHRMRRFSRNLSLVYPGLPP
ncbi:unnamed protein product [Tilletia laevis]|uniref:Uncharacterized protein n=4 Tax=Tilletia TaxID=13289 RepID=A0A8X7MS78_9BASI|nr:hypothetical protein CF336_g4775 [Tilletia laevis]KAE8204141.1 hypothetical protein CF328_g1257 [Tilletia controversa]KAE8263782.1 hypothetical protein A4X03_0g1419 [Tilletia caries]KAE8246326.1 hypothetical protein A4X06_0g5060 [Tilletia controversa]CAD6940254.1 unnamed protein product [Tilletia laevis]